MADLVAAGKVHHLGSPKRPRTRSAVHTPPPDHRAPDRVVAVDRDPETNGVLDTVRELGIGFVAYSPLAVVSVRFDQQPRRSR